MDGVTRGDLVLIVLAGELGKPRPALVVQSDLLDAETPSSYIVCPLTTGLTGQHDIRVPVEPHETNGLAAKSEVMVDKVSAAPGRRLREVIGHLDSVTLSAVDRALVLVLGIA